MNQILTTENKNRKGGPLEIKTVVIIFTVCLLIFGGFLIGKSAYSIINKNKEEGISEPVIQVTEVQNQLNVKVTHDKLIDKIAYSWGGAQEVVLQGKGRKEILETIDIPKGNNVLVLNVTDITGKTVTYSQEYEGKEIDITEPSVDIQKQQEGDQEKVKIVAKDETALDYIVYYWNEEDETKINAREDSPKQIEEKIDAIKGINTLTVIAVDKAGNQKTEKIDVVGTNKPKISVSKSETSNELIVKVTDEEEIKKIDYILNGQNYSTDPNNIGNSLGVKEVEFRIPLVQGENKIAITAYSTSTLSRTIETELTVD